MAYVRPHMGLAGKTPAEVAGLPRTYGPAPFMSLIVAAIKAKKAGSHRNLAGETTAVVSA